MPVPGESFGRYFGAEKPEFERQEQERLEQERLEELNLDRLRMIGGEVIKLSVLEPGEGQPEIFDTIQGEGRNMGKHTAFLRLSECNQSCSWSPEEHQRVLMHDWSDKMLKDVEIGDKIIGVSIRPIDNRTNSLTVATVTNKTTEYVDTLYKLTTDKGEIVLDEHDQVWLTGDKGRVHSGWRNILKVKPSQSLRQLFGQSDVNIEEFEKGWLAGSIDGDGTRWWNGNSTRFRFAVSEPEYVERVYSLLMKYGADVKIGVHTATGFSGCKRTYKSVTGRDDILANVIAIDKPTASYKRGYLAGMYDSEGSRGKNSNIRISQSQTANPDKWARIGEYLSDLGFDYNASSSGYRIKGGLPEVYRFYKWCTPYLARKKESILGQSVRGIGKVKSIEKINGGNIVHLTTSSSNLVVNGFLLHNCDTPQTWAFTEAKAAVHDTETVYNKLDWQVKKEVEDIVEQVFATNPESLVITGGEPLMQQNAVINLIKGLREKNPDYHTEIETAGTIVIKDELLELLDQINCSPKIANSGNPLNKRRKPLALQKLAEAEKTDFKFVVTKEEDVEEILELVELSGISNDRVFLMPEGRTPEEIQRHSVMVGDLVKKHGFNMTTRLHILMYGAKRNV